MIHNIPYLRNKISTLLVLSAAIALVLTSTLLPLSNPLLLQPVQASSIGSSSSSGTLTFKTTEPAEGVVQCSQTSAMITFDAQGTPSSSNPQRVDITGGTFQISDSRDRQILYSGNINGGRFANSSSGGGGSLFIYTDVNHVPNGTSTCASTDDTLTIDTGACSTSNANPIYVGLQGGTADSFGSFNGAVECSSSSQGGGGNTTSSSMTAGTTTTQDRDSDGDGIPDSSDRCTHNSNPRCFKEGGDVCTTAQQQQQSSSSSNRTGNQTR